MYFIKAVSVLAAVLALRSSSYGQDGLKEGGVFLEPSITYQSGDTTVTYPGPFSDSKENLKGFGLGLRAGVHVYESLFLAADGRYARPDYKSSALDGTTSAEATNLGLTFGAQTPFAGVRVWGTYILGGSLNPQEINNVDVKFNDLKGYRLGAGLYVASMSVNLEYQDAKYGSATLEEFGSVTSESVKGSDKSYILSVSFPVAL